MSDLPGYQALLGRQRDCRDIVGTPPAQTLVVLVHTERRRDMHIISLRKAEKYEARYYFEIAQDQLR
ncbi:MAG: hypothetical protein ACRETU_08535 [Steroidobacterales bacterium]